MTYEYVCTACAHEWEADQSIKDPALKDCPECHQATAKRQVSGGTGFVLKGGGWYADLYSSAKPSKASSDEGSKDSKDKPTETKSKSESKGESSAKAESKASDSSSTSGSSSSTSPSKTAD